MATRLSTVARNAAADAIVDLIDAGPAAGTLTIRTGPQPANANDAPTGTILATFTLTDPAFGAAALGIATLDTTPVLSTTGVAAGNAGWFRVADSTGVTMGDGAIGLSGEELNMNTVAIGIGLTVEITAGTATMPASTP